MGTKKMNTICYLLMILFLVSLLIRQPWLRRHATPPLQFIPEVLSSAGYYEIIPEKEEYQIVYLHQDRLSPSFCRDIYVYLAKKEAVKFLQKLKNYVERKCY